PLLASQITHLHVEPRVQIRDRSFGLELCIQSPRCHWLDPDFFENFSYVQIVGLKGGGDFSAGRHDRRARPEISPHEWNRNIAGCKFRLALVKLNLADL